MKILTEEEIKKIEIDARPFPIQGGTLRDENGECVRPITHYAPSKIPWWLAEEAYKFYSEKYGTVQSLERLAERGGFGREELLMLLRRSFDRKVF